MDAAARTSRRFEVLPLRLPVIIAAIFQLAGCATTPERPQEKRSTAQAKQPQDVEEPTAVPVVPPDEAMVAPIDGGPVPTLFAKVVDVGQGLCVLILTPARALIVYDTGSNSRCAKAAAKLAGSPRPVVSLLILSHEDTDHIGGLKSFMRTMDVKQVLRTGYDRRADKVRTWERNQGLLEKFTDSDLNLSKTRVPPGTTFTFGEENEVELVVVAGWNEVPRDWPVDGEGERRNAASIVVRVTFDGKSLLLPGDTVGRPRSENVRHDAACESAEAFMVAIPTVFRFNPTSS